MLSFAIAGSVVSLVLMLAGFAWLGVRRELEVSRMISEQAGDFAMEDRRGRPAFGWFRGLSTGISFAAEKPTCEIIALLAAGRWREGLP